MNSKLDKKYIEAAEKLNWTHELEDFNNNNHRFTFTAHNGTAYYIVINDEDNGEAGQLAHVYFNEFDEDELVMEYIGYGFTTREILSDTDSIGECIYRLALLWDEIDKEVIDKEVEAEHELFTNSELQAISGALLAQMINISTAIEKVAQTADESLTGALEQHRRELQNLHSKVCGMMDA